MCTIQNFYAILLLLLLLHLLLLLLLLRIPFLLFYFFFFTSPFFYFTSTHPTKPPGHIYIYIYIYLRTLINVCVCAYVCAFCCVCVCSVSTFTIRNIITYAYYAVKFSHTKNNKTARGKTIMKSTNVKKTHKNIKIFFKKRKEKKHVLLKWDKSQSI